MYPTGSALACIYSTPEMHKLSSSDAFPKLCPIVTTAGFFEYDLAHFLCNFLSPVAPDDYSCKDTFSFSQIKNANHSGKFLVFCDVTSLFTNIPFQKPIDIAINLSKITKKEVRKLLLFATSKT